MVYYVNKCYEAHLVGVGTPVAGTLFRHTIVEKQKFHLVLSGGRARLA